MSKIKCNGYSFNAPEYSESTKKLAFDLFEELRPVMMRELASRFGRRGDLYDGYRFKDNDSTLLRLCSAASEEVFLQNPRQWAWAALECCADADYWYTFEKDWG